MPKQHQILAAHKIYCEKDTTEVDICAGIFYVIFLRALNELETLTPFLQPNPSQREVVLET